MNLIAIISATIGFSVSNLKGKVKAACIITSIITSIALGIILEISCCYCFFMKVKSHLQQQAPQAQQQGTTTSTTTDTISTTTGTTTSPHGTLRPDIKLYTQKTSITSADILNDKILPFYEKQDSILLIHYLYRFHPNVEVDHLQ